MTQISGSLYVGSLAEFGGKQGVVQDFNAETSECNVVDMATGETTVVDSQKLTLPKALDRFGVGGIEKSFDLFIGPQSKVQHSAESISACLSEKGFCVMKVSQDETARKTAINYIGGLEEEGQLERLPFEVEEGYLGFGGKGVVAWLDEDSYGCPDDPFIQDSDEFFSELMIALLPHSDDCLGAVCEHRTSGLVSFALSESELVEFPHALAEDKILGDFLRTWRRGQLRGVRFMGPDVGSVVLTPLAGKEDQVPVEISRQMISAGPNTVVLFKPSVWRYEVDLPPGTLSLNVTFMEPEAQLVVETPGDASALGELYPGPKPPAASTTAQHCHTRLGGGWDMIEGYAGSLSVGCDGAIEYPRARFDWEQYFNSDTDNAEPWDLIAKHMTYCEGLHLFDNKYFNIPAAEAMTMGPMQRHVLETGAVAMAKNGITKKVADRTPSHAGCAVGLDKDDWNRVDKPSEMEGGNNVIAIISNRFSYSFNMKGSNYICDTACSASLVATHFARLLMNDRTYDALEFFMCIGVHNCLAMFGFKATMAGMITVEGRCKTFNETADGYLRGDGCSGFIMKWGDEKGSEEGVPDAIMRGSMSGQNGRSATLTAPNGLSQEDVCWKAIREARADPGECSIWSCHGTGTSLGDPIEVGGVRKINKGKRSNVMHVSSNKPNTGHLEGGAAMTSILAVIWQCRMMKANPVIHLGVQNPHLVTGEFDARFITEMNIFGPERGQGHAHVSSFGFGGTNGHAVFWGRDHVNVPDPKKLFMKRLSMMASPEIVVHGTNPEDWEHELPDLKISPGTVYSVPVATGTTEEIQTTPIRYIKEEEGLDDGVTDSDVAYSISGNFNEWEMEEMDVSDVPGSRVSYVEIPESGRLEFNFIQTVMPDLVLAPAYDQCMKKTAPIIGPAEELMNKWVITDRPGVTMRINLFVGLGIKTISWFPVQEKTGMKSVLDVLDDL